MTTIQLKKAPIFKDPKWSDAEAAPGKEVTVSVTAEDLLPTQTVHFEIRSGTGKEVLALLDADGSHQAKWTAPLPPDTTADGTEYLLVALLREKPAAANGHLSVQQRLPARDKLKVKGARITDLKADSWFVPKQENLVVKYKVKGTAPKKGRYEIWGERYPTDKPLYTSDLFDPASGDNEWKKWSGKSNDGKKHLSTETADSFLTPEFSPYRLRIVLGPDEDSIKAPYEKGKGLGKVVVAEVQFEVVIHKVHIRIQKDFADTWDGDKYNKDKYKLSQALAIESRDAADRKAGRYALMGRLPKDKTDTEPAEKGRLRIPMASHWGPGQLFDQGTNGDKQSKGETLYLNKDYVINSGKKTKYTVDKGYHVRPELPLEFEVRLRSRKYTTFPADEQKPGLFEPEAVGPLRLEPFAEDGYHKDLYHGGDAIHQTYWRNAVSMIKQGAHSAPKHSGTNKPIVEYWQARFAIQNDDEVDFDVAAAASEHQLTSPDFAWVANKAKDELFVYLNRTRLFLAENDDEFKKRQKDFKLATATSTTKIKLQTKLTKKGDVLWIVRTVSAPAQGAAEDKWKACPPGTNCHVHYGGIRGEAPNNLWRKNYSASANFPPTPGTDKEPIIGKPGTAAEFTTYKEKKYIDLEPDPVDADKQERVELQAQVADPKKGLAGILFSPSYIAGDSYILHARVEHGPYRRSFGCVTPKPQRDDKTGQLTVWRTMLIHSSLRLPDVGTVGLADAVVAAGTTPAKDAIGCVADAALGARDHPGDGRNMRVSLLNDNFEPAFNEWTMVKLVPVIGASNETPIKITAPEHRLKSGDVVWITDVPLNLAANGTFVVEVDDPKTFRLFKNWPAVGWAAPIDPVVATGELKPEGVKVFEPPAAVAITAASNDAPIKITTGADHGLATGQEVIIRDVKGNPAANGIFKVTVGGAKDFTLNDSDGTESGAYDSGGTVRRTNVTNTAPIRITTEADHGLSDNDSIAVIGVEGNLTANGIFKVKKLDNRNIELLGSDGTTGGEYTRKGTVHRCGRLDCHRGANLRDYANQYNGIAGLGKGAVQMNSVKDIQNQFMPFDHYRENLPPDLPDNRINVASNAIKDLPKGTLPKEAMKAVKKAINDYRANPTDPALIAGATAYAGGGIPGGDADATKPPGLAAWPNFIGNAIKDGNTTWAAIDGLARDTYDQQLKPGVTAITVYSAGDVDDYEEWIEGVCDNDIQTPLEALLIAPEPSGDQPKSMPVIRWPTLGHDEVWVSAKCDSTTGEPQFRGSTTITNGSASPGGTSRFRNLEDDPAWGTFIHEMGHSCHLSHFVVNGGDFNWKQHHLLSGDCLMSYRHCSGFVPRPAAAVGPNDGAAAADTGWPDKVTPIAKVTQVAGGGPPSTNEKQKVEFNNSNATGGTFSLSGIDMPFNASAGQVRSALGGAWGGVANFGASGGPLPGSAVTYEFKGAYAAKPYDALDPDSTNLTGPFIDPLPDSLSKAEKQATYNTDDRTVAFVAPIARDKACAKCILKLRGWNEEVLPCAWKHPDLF